ncbi:YitT family protein [Tannockella kyphosi]|uniref:YitT family protein n=1 Tax=Tannockella kyphosi TaxID=2899121 RepID=UPI002011A531|nr:YitT family protein [Tannockella kyphosi]
MQSIRKTFVIIIGNFILALGVMGFIIPSGIITGGVTGIALVCQHFFGTSISLVVYLVNGLMFILGYSILGKKFALGTLLSTLIYPFFLMVLGNVEFFNTMTSDLLLSAIYAGLLIGLGMGLVLREGASTGGMDIPPLILNRFTGISVAIFINIVDVVILSGQTFFSTIEQILYGILVVIITTVVIDRIMLLGEESLQVTIISKEAQAIRDEIFNRLDRGCTFLNVTTGYHQHQQLAVMVVLNKRELRALNELSLEIDPDAFIIINETHSVKGRGFTLPSVDE